MFGAIVGAVKGAAATVAVGAKAVAANAVAVSAPMLMQEANTSADIDTFTGYATKILTWLITCFTSILNFMLANPICFVWLIVSLIGAAFVFLRRTIGG